MPIAQPWGGGEEGGRDRKKGWREKREGGREGEERGEEGLSRITLRVYCNNFLFGSIPATFHNDLQ